MESSSCLRASREVGALDPEAKFSPYMVVLVTGEGRAGGWPFKRALRTCRGHGQACSAPRPTWALCKVPGQLDHSVGGQEMGRHRQSPWPLPLAPSSKLFRQCQNRESTLRCQAWPRPLSLVSAFHNQMAIPFLHSYCVPGTLN